MGLLAALSDLALPRVCIGCGRPGELWCAPCRPVRRRLRTELAGVPVIAAVRYEGATARALVHFKERGRWDLAPPLAALLTAALADLVREMPSARAPVLVPVPSAPAAVRRRGGDHVAALAGPAGRRVGLRVRPTLRLRGAVRDSVGLGAAERRANLHTAMTAVGGAGRTAIVVDDLVTTGASVGEAVRALRAAQWQVLGAAAVAASRAGTE